MCLRPVAATLSNQSGAGFGSWLARDTDSATAQSLVLAAWPALDVFAGAASGQHVVEHFSFSFGRVTGELSILRRL